VRGRRAEALAITAAVVVVPACAETTIDTSITTPPSAEATTTVFAPTGTTTQLLDELLTESGELSDRIVENRGQQDAFARIETLWALVGPDLEVERPDLVPGFQSAIDLLRTGVDRRRPADADKATNNLRTLIAAYVAQ
jgi:hypothetical protein